MLLKNIVEVLSSTTSILAIAGVGIGWYRSARKPLKITRTVVHLKKIQANCTFILVVRNLASYPVIIHRCDAYTGKKHEVQKKRGGNLEYSERFSSNDALFINSKLDFEVPAKGHTDLRIHLGNEQFQIPKRILFLLETSHGYHELRCKRILPVEMESVETYSLEYQYQSRSRVLARLYYCKKWITELTRRCS